MSNLAYKVQHQQQTQQQPQQEKKVLIKRRGRISLGEKILGLLFTAFVLIGGLQIVSNNVAIYNLNIENQQLKTSIEEQTKVNSDLTVQVKELSTYERIWEKAQELGLKLNENNVKVVD